MFLISYKIRSVSLLKYQARLVTSGYEMLCGMIPQKSYDINKLIIHDIWKKKNLYIMW